MTKRDIMIVDDNPANLKLLEDMLLQKGHRARSFPRGRLALAAAAIDPPDLILLDIGMPEMDGYEVCRRLKASETLSEIPVIFLSALNEAEDKVKAFQAGGIDYVSKPFQFDEIQARVETHLQLHQFRQALKSQNKLLEEAVAARTRELAQANHRLTILDQSKNDFLNLISHELRTPLNGLLGIGDILLDMTPATPETDEFREMFNASRQRILSILDDALLLTEVDINGDRFRPTSISLASVLREAMVQAAEFSQSRGVTFLETVPTQALAMGHEELFTRALKALLITAVKFSSPQTVVRISQNGQINSPKITIESDGLAIPETALNTFFNIFALSEVSTSGGDLGLEPAVAFRIFSLFGATLEVANRSNPGIRLTVSLVGTET